MVTDRRCYIGQQWRVSKVDGMATVTACDGRATDDDDMIQPWCFCTLWCLKRHLVDCLLSYSFWFSLDYWRDHNRYQEVIHVFLARIPSYVIDRNNRHDELFDVPSHVACLNIRPTSLMGLKWPAHSRMNMQPWRKCNCEILEFYKVQCTGCDPRTIVFPL